MRDVNKKLKLAEEKNTRVVFCNVPETGIMIKLATDVDKVYKVIRKNSGVTIDNEKAQKYLKEFLMAAYNLEEFLVSLSDELKIKNIQRSNILMQLTKAQGE